MRHAGIRTVPSAGFVLPAPARAPAGVLAGARAAVNFREDLA
jgi:hypothetical protein